MSTPEKKVKDAIKRVLDTHDVYYFMPTTGGYGRSGIPDFICCIKGRFLAIEAKAHGGMVTALQQREMLKIEAAGGIPMIVKETNLDQLELTVKWLASL
jgi:hypothetical protein